MFIFSCSAKPDRTKGPDRSVQVSSFIRPCAEQKHLRLRISPIWYVSLSFPPSVGSGEPVRSVCTEQSSIPCPNCTFCRMSHWINRDQLNHFDLLVFKLIQQLLPDSLLLSFRYPVRSLIHMVLLFSRNTYMSSLSAGSDRQPFSAVFFCFQKSGFLPHPVYSPSLCLSSRIC